MLYTVFTHDGYILRSDECKEELINKNKYDNLFNFLNTDLNKLSFELQSEKLNLLNTFKKINHNNLRYSQICSIGDKMKIIHPYFGMVITPENHPFFNMSLGSQYIMIELLFCLFDELSMKNGRYDIFDKMEDYKNIIELFHQNWIANFFGNWYYLVSNNRRNISNIFFADLIDTQRKLLSWSYLFLDLDANYLKELNKTQRISMYGFYSNSILNLKEISKTPLSTTIPLNEIFFSDITITEHLHFSNFDNNNEIIEVNNKKGFSKNLNSTHLKTLYNLQIAYLKPDDPKIEETIKYNVENYNNEITTNEYWTKEIISPNLQVLLEYEFSRLLESDLMIRKCKSCGSYFIPKNNKTFYCSRKNSETGEIYCTGNTKERHIQKLKELNIWKEYNGIINKIRYVKKSNNKFKKENLKNPSLKTLVNENLEKLDKMFEKFTDNKKRLLSYANVQDAKSSKYYKEFLETADEIKKFLKEQK